MDPALRASEPLDDRLRQSQRQYQLDADPNNAIPRALALYRKGDVEEAYHFLWDRGLWQKNRALCEEIGAELLERQRPILERLVELRSSARASLHDEGDRFFDRLLDARDVDGWNSLELLLEGERPVYGLILQGLFLMRNHWQLIGQLPGLRALRFAWQALAPVPLIEILNRNHSLRKVELFFQDGASEAFEALEPRPAIKALRFHHPIFDQGSIERLNRFEELEALDFGAARPRGVALEVEIRDQQLQGLTQLKSLKRLNLAHARISSLGARQLARFKTLEWLNLNHTAIHNDGLDGVGELTEMRELFLQETLIGAGAIRKLEKLSQLKTLDLRNTHIQDADLEGLRAFPKLESLNLFRTSITDRGVEALRRVQSLKHLNIAQTATTPRARRRLKFIKELWV